LAVDRIDGPKQAVDLGLVIGAEVAAGAVLGAQDDEAIACVIAAVMFGMVFQSEGESGLRSPADTKLHPGMAR
jgi:hypothetical protein